jgi:hypothetical protein
MSTFFCVCTKTRRRPDRFNGLSININRHCKEGKESGEDETGKANRKAKVPSAITSFTTAKCPNYG